MAQIIKLRRSAVAGNVPTTSQLGLGELAINTADGKIYFEKNDGSATIQTIVTTNSETTGSITITGNISGSSTSTGSFGRVQSTTLNSTGDITSTGGHISLNGGRIFTAGGAEPKFEMSTNAGSAVRFHTSEGSYISVGANYSAFGVGHTTTGAHKLRVDGRGTLRPFGIANNTTVVFDVDTAGNVTGSGNLEIAGNISGSSTSTGSLGLVELSSNSSANASLLKLNYGALGSTGNHAVLSVNAQGSLRIMSKANNSVFEIGLYNNKQFQFEKFGASGGGGFKVYQSSGESNNFAQIKSTTPDVDTAAFSVNGYYNGNSGLGGDLGNGSTGTVALIGKHVYLNNRGTGGATEGKVGAGILPVSASARLQVSATENYLTSSALFKATIGDNTTGLTDVFTVTGDNKISGSATSTGSFGRLAVGTATIQIPSNGFITMGSEGGMVKNTRFGNNTGQNLQAGGTQNVLIGEDVGGALTTGDKNVAMGVEALKTATGDQNNTAIGYRALKTLNQNGLSGNSAFGYYAGESLATGTFNTLIGYNAQTNANDDTKSIVIGASATGLGDNTTVIGDSTQTLVAFGGDALISGSATSTGSFGRIETAGNSIITGNLDVGSSLDVTGNIEASNYLKAGGNLIVGATDAMGIRFDQSSGTDSTHFSIHQNGASGKDIVINANGSGNRVILSNANTASLATDQDNNVLFPAHNAKISGSHSSTGSFGSGRISDKLGIGTVAPVSRLEIEDGGTSKAMLLKLTSDDNQVYGIVVGNDTFSTSDTDGGQHILGNDGTYIIRSIGTSTAARIGAGTAWNNYKYLEIDFDSDTAEFTTTKISGSATSTGSFGTLRVGSTVGSLSSGLSFGDGNTGFFENSDNILYVTTNGSNRWQFNGGSIMSLQSGGPALYGETASSTNPTLIPHIDDGDTGIGRASADNLSLIAGGAEILRLASNTISGSATSTGSFGRVEAQVVHADGFQSTTGGVSVLFNDSVEVIGNVSGSSTSTGSFGRLESNTFNTTTFNSTTVTSATINVTGQITGSSLDISGNMTGSGNLEIAGNISGSAASTGSFGSLKIADAHQGTLKINGGLTLSGAGPNINGAGGAVYMIPTNFIVRSTISNDSGDVTVGDNLTVTGNISGSGTGSFGAGLFHHGVKVGTDHTANAARGPFDVRVSDNNQGFYVGSGGGAVYLPTDIGHSSNTGTFDLQPRNYRLGTNGGGAVSIYPKHDAQLNLGTTDDNDLLVLSGSTKISGSAASTGSFGSLIVSDAVQGNLTIEGDLIARQYIVSSSVTHLTSSAISGSSTFGDTSDDIHQFTGSVSFGGPVTASSNISGSSTSTGSFGSLVLADAVQGTLRVKSEIRLQATPAVSSPNFSHYASNGTTRLNEFKIMGDNSTILKTSGAYNLRFGTNDVDRLMIQQGTGNVGIGTTSPGAKLEVIGDISGSATSTGSFGALRVGSDASYVFANRAIIGHGDTNDGITLQSGATHQGNIAFNHSNGTTAHGRISYQHNTNYMSFFTNNSERIRIDTNGNLISYGGNISGSSTSTGSFGAGFIDNKLGIGTLVPEEKLSIKNGAIQLENGKNLTWSDIGDGNTGRVRIVGNEDNDFIRMHVDNNNNKSLALTGTGVGIGNLNPTEKLTVEGDISASGDFHLDGQAGIGRSPSSTYALEIQQPAGSNLDYIQGVQDNGSNTAFRIDTDGSDNVSLRLYNGSGAQKIHLNAGGTSTFEGNVSGSATSTGSFGRVFVDGGNIATVGNMILDADGAQIRLQDGGTEFGRISRVSSDLVIKSISNNNDILFKGVDGGGTITALQLDMSEGGNAIFSANISGSATSTGSFGTVETSNIKVGGGIFTSASLAAGGGGGGGGAIGAVTNGADNRIATFSSNNDLNGEANLTFDDTTLIATGNISSSGQFIAKASTDAGSPGYTFAGDLDTGLYHAGANTLGLTTGGTIRMSLTSGALSSQTTGGGRIGIPNGSAAGPTFTFNDDPDTGMFRVGADTIGLSTGGSERVRIDSNGNFGIGTTASKLYTGISGTSARYLSIVGTAASTIELGRDASSDGYAVGRLQFLNLNNADSSNNDADGKLIAYISSHVVTSDSNAGDDSGGDLRFITKPEAGAWVERMRITSAGNVGIGQTTPDSGSLLHVTYSDNTTSTTATGTGQHNYGIKLENTSTTTGAFSQLHLRAGTADGYIRYIYNNTNDGRLGFFVDNTNDVKEVFTISNDGKQISGSSTSTGSFGALVVPGKATIGNSLLTGFDDEANDLIVGDGTGDSGLTIYGGQNAGDFGSIHFADGTSSTAAKAGYIKYEQNTSAMTFGINGVTRATLDISGDFQPTGNISGSATSTGSFGRVQAEHIHSTDDMTVADDLTVDGLIVASGDEIRGSYSLNKLTFPATQRAAINDVFFIHSTSGRGSLQLVGSTSRVSSNTLFGFSRDNINEFKSDHASVTYTNFMVEADAVIAFPGSSGATQAQDLSIFKSNVTTTADHGYGRRLFLDFRRDNTAMFTADMSGSIYAFGNISGSSTSTGSFGKLYINGTPNQAATILNVEGHAEFADGVMAMLGSKQIKNYNHAGTNISFASALDLSSEAVLSLKSNNSNNNKWYIGLDGSITGSAGNHISASATSTGSFGHLNIAGPGDNVANFQSGNRTLSLKLNDSAPSGDVGVQFRAGASDYLGLAAGGGSDYGIVIHSNSKVAIGHENPNAKLDVSGGIIASGDISGSATSTGSFGHGIIDGNLDVGGTVTAQEFHTEFVSSSIVFQSGSTKFGDTQDDAHNFTGSLNITGSSTLDGDVEFTAANAKISGSATSTGSFGALVVPGQASVGSVVEASSIEYKENITQIDSPLEKITKLRGVEFDYKNTNEHSIGMIAEEVNDIFPELVTKDDKGDVTAMSYTRMTAVLLEAVKELTEEVRELKAKNNYTKEKGKN